jgi:hypothetical protein
MIGAENRDTSPGCDVRVDEDEMVGHDGERRRGGRDHLQCTVQNKKEIKNKYKKRINIKKIYIYKMFKYT